MENRLIIAGFGGQGVMMIGQLICVSAMNSGKEALFLPHYGPEQRGGTANCKVIVSDESIVSPLYRNTDILIAMNTPSLIKYQKDVKKDGVIFINSSRCDLAMARKDVQRVEIPLDKMADELGSGKVANIIMLGAYAGYSNTLDKEQVMKAVLTKLGKKPELLELNQKAIELGYSITG